MLKLHTKSDCENQAYLALSHRWGSLPKYQPFCTLRNNVEHFHERIEFDALPETFKDAVRLARLLDIRCLWIDSLCIIQDSEEDWQVQSREMEDVFRNAYCSIAASRAKGNSDGFLQTRAQREAVPLQDNFGNSYYICEAIDDFQKDVLDGELNQRGWVLQERALAHRTIFYTDRQVYWECGNGIQCETLKHMRK